MESMAKENLYTPDCIRTVSGQYVNVFDTDPNTILIEDIAHSLSHQCRFGGHLPSFFSVAQHCVNVSYCVPEEHAFAGLMHDASEAYLLDMPKPIKDRMPEYKAIERKLMQVIALKFGFNYPLHHEIKKADKAKLEDEWENVFLLKGQYLCWSKEKAQILFMERFRELTK